MYNCIEKAKATQRELKSFYRHRLHAQGRAEVWRREAGGELIRAGHTHALGLRGADRAVRNHTRAVSEAEKPSWKHARRKALSLPAVPADSDRRRRGLSL